MRGVGVCSGSLSMRNSSARELVTVMNLALLSGWMEWEDAKRMDFSLWRRFYWDRNCCELLLSKFL